MHLWRTVIGGNRKTTFDFTEYTTEKDKNRVTNYFETDQSYSQEEPVIKPIIEATIKLCKTLNFDLKKNYVVLERGFTELIFIYGCGVFDARLSDGVVIVSTENGWCFTREQFNAIFDFIDVIKKSNWFF